MSDSTKLKKRVIEPEKVIPFEKQDDSVADPRSRGLSDAKKGVHTFLTADWDLDSCSVGSPAPCQIVIQHLNDKITERMLISEISSLTSFKPKNVVLFYHPISNRFIGLALVEFAMPSAARCALALIEKEQRFMGSYIYVAWDPKGQKCTNFYKDIVGHELPPLASSHTPVASSQPFIIPSDTLSEPLVTSHKAPISMDTLLSLPVPSVESSSTLTLPSVLPSTSAPCSDVPPPVHNAFNTSMSVDSRISSLLKRTAMLNATDDTKSDQPKLPSSSHLSSKLANGNIKGAADGSYSSERKSAAGTSAVKLALKTEPDYPIKTSQNEKSERTSSVVIKTKVTNEIPATLAAASSTSDSTTPLYAICFKDVKFSLKDVKTHFQRHIPDYFYLHHDKWYLCYRQYADYRNAYRSLDDTRLHRQRILMTKSSVSEKEAHQLQEKTIAALAPFSKDTDKEKQANVLKKENTEKKEKDEKQSQTNVSFHSKDTNASFSRTTTENSGTMTSSATNSATVTPLPVLIDEKELKRRIMSRIVNDLIEFAVHEVKQKLVDPSMYKLLDQWISEQKERDRKRTDEKLKAIQLEHHHQIQQQQQQQQREKTLSEDQPSALIDDSDTVRHQIQEELRASISLSTPTSSTKPSFSSFASLLSDLSIKKKKSFDDLHSRDGARPSNKHDLTSALMHKENDDQAHAKGTKVMRPEKLKKSKRVLRREREQGKRNGKLHLSKEDEEMEGPEEFNSEEDEDRHGKDTSDMDSHTTSDEEINSDETEDDEFDTSMASEMDDRSIGSDESMDDDDDVDYLENRHHRRPSEKSSALLKKKRALSTLPELKHLKKPRKETAHRAQKADRLMTSIAILPQSLATATVQKRATLPFSYTYLSAFHGTVDSTEHLVNLSLDPPLNKALSILKEIEADSSSASLEEDYFLLAALLGRSPTQDAHRYKEKTYHIRRPSLRWMEDNDEKEEKEDSDRHREASDRTPYKYTRWYAKVQSFMKKQAREQGSSSLIDLVQDNKDFLRWIVEALAVFPQRHALWEQLDVLRLSLRHPSGCARTEGESRGTIAQLKQSYYSVLSSMWPTVMESLADSQGSGSWQNTNSYNNNSNSSSSQYYGSQNSVLGSQGSLYSGGVSTGHMFPLSPVNTAASLSNSVSSGSSSFAGHPSGGSGGPPLTSSSRSVRANHRRLVTSFGGETASLTSNGDLLKFNQLQTRRKALKFSRSAIHAWGLYADEDIDVNDMVIEYCGEIVSQAVANHREKMYERQGIDSSYLFRLDEDRVIDATIQGNLARFINHSCDANCQAKIITVDNQPKIVFYARKPIAKEEELTFDYKFPIEEGEDKIMCRCGAQNCRKYLN